MNTPIHNFLMTLPNAKLDYPFGEDIHVYKVEGKIFATYIKDEHRERVTVKCDPEKAQQLRAIFTEIT